MKHTHEFRDPIHTFIAVREDERAVINSRAFQRLRQIHQLALTYLVYPGATHRRFEHSLGVMELASKIFDTVTRKENLLTEGVRNIVPDDDGVRYWRSVLRMAALCHDIGHLPFSHAAEKELLPPGFDHESMTIKLINSEEMRQIWWSMTPPLRAEDIAKLAVGPKKLKEKFTTWEILLSEIIVGDAFGADRIDYLLRDSYHSGVSYGKFDHYRLIGSLRILPTEYNGSDEPALGLKYGGLESSEALMLARHFIYKQVYFHKVRRAYDLHLVDFLKSWLPEGVFSTEIEGHLALCDADVIAAIRAASRDDGSKAYQLARRIDERGHFKVFYSYDPDDVDGGVLEPGKTISNSAIKEFGQGNVKHDYIPAKATKPEFPVATFDGRFKSSLTLSEILHKLPILSVDRVYCKPEIKNDAIKWIKNNKLQLLNLSVQAELVK